jgi:PAS domain S-box-containing protein
MVSLVLVENEFVAAEDISSRLRAAGFDIVGTPATGKDAIAQARKLHPDVVLIDPELKGKMDGIEAAHQIKERFDIPVIFLTAEADAATARRATEIASSGFLVKPFDDLELSAAIEMAIYAHKMEIMARESDRCIRGLTESLSEVIFETDMVGNITFVNHAGLKEFGYTKEQVEGGMTLYDFLPPEKHEEIRKLISQAVVDEPSSWTETLGLRRDGSTFPVSVRASVIVRDGVFEGLRGIAIDITERKRADAALIKSERRIREVTDALPVVVYETDATGRITFVNATVFEMFGYTKEELEAGMSIFHVVTAADKERARAVFRRRTSLDSVGRMEYTGLRKDGSTFPVAAHGAPIRRDGALVGVRGIVVDITEQKRAEERVKEHTDTIEILNHIMTEGNRAASVESFAETVTKLTLELMHFDVGTIHLGDDDTRCAHLRYATGIPDAVIEAIREIPLDEAPYAGFFVEPKPLFVDGHEVSRVPHAAELGLESLATVPLYRYDALIGALNVGSFQHHTFSQAEKELLTAIGNEVGVVIAKLQADELIRAALKERETLLKEIHHRVKNNMQVVSSLLSLQADQATNVEAQAVLTASQSQIRSMALIHEKLYSSGTLSEIDFADYVESLIDELLRMYNVAPGAITITTDIEDVHFGVDTAMPCALILNELVSNCLKYAFPDERTGEVTIGFQYADGSYTMTVADDGVGFPADVDFRATGSLGMQLVTALVGQLNGTIEMNREDGTSFVISFSLPP